MKLYHKRDFPPEYCASCDHLLRAKAACNNEHVGQIATLSAERISLARHARAEMFDREKLRADNVYVDRPKFAGSGMYYGTEDVLFSFHLNRTILGNPNEESQKIYARYSDMVCRALRQYGILVYVKSQHGRKKNTGVCLNLEGRSEMIGENGEKLVAGVYQDNNLVFSMHGVILVSDTWKKIYDYVRERPKMATAGSLRNIVPEADPTDIIASLIAEIDDVELTHYTDSDYHAMRRLAPQFEFSQWQE